MLGCGLNSEIEKLEQMLHTREVSTKVMLCHRRTADVLMQLRYNKKKRESTMSRKN